MGKRLVVVGGGLGGLSAAIHGRRLGFDVTLLEQRDVIGGKAAGFESTGFRFDPGPSIVILPRIYRELFASVGRNMEDYLEFDRLDPITRVIWKGRNWDLPSSANACVEVAESIEPAARPFLTDMLKRFDRIVRDIDRTVFAGPIESIKDFLNPSFMRMGPSMMAPQGYRTAIDARLEHPVLRAFFYGFPSYSGLDYRTRSLSPLLIPFFMMREGVFHPRGGVAAIPSAFRRLAEELGVTISTNLRVEKIHRERNRIVAINDVPADAVISNIDPLTFGTILGRTHAVEPSFSYYTIQWGLSRRLGGLSHHTLLLPDDPQTGFADLYERGEFPQAPITYLNVVSETDPTVAPPGSTNLFAVVSSPAQTDKCDWNTIAKTAYARTRASLAHHGFTICDEEITVESIQTPLTFQARDGSYQGSLYGPEESKRTLGGMFPLTNRDAEIRNLFYAGGAVQPGAGMPMVTLSGRFAAMLAARSQNLL